MPAIRFVAFRCAASSDAARYVLASESNSAFL